MNDSDEMATEESPCVGVCALDTAGENCLGCHRTVPEIAGWARMTPRAQRSLKQQLQRRAAVAGIET